MSSSVGWTAKLDIGRCFNEGFEVYKRNILVLVLAAVIVELLTIVTLGILGGPLCGGACLMTLGALRREDKVVRLGDLFGAFDRFWPLVGLFFLVVVACLGGLAFFILPGLLLMALWFYPFYLVVDANLPVLEALRVSWRTVMQRGLRVHLLLTIITLGVQIGPAFIPALGYVIGWFVTPMVWLVESSAYRQVVEADREGLAGMPGGFPVIPMAQVRQDEGGS